MIHKIAFLQDMVEKKKLPHFESFVIEEEEGSGSESLFLSW